MVRGAGDDEPDDANGPSQAKEGKVKRRLPAVVRTIQLEQGVAAKH